MTQPTITAGGFALRPFTPADIPWVYAVSLDPAVQKYVQIPLPYRMEDADFFVRDMCIGAWERRERAEFVVVGGAGERLGRVALGLDGNGAAQVGYWMDPAARRRGLATRALQELCRWGFAELRLGLIEWRAEVGNVASRRVAEKAGFTVEAVLRRRLVHRGERVDAWIGSILPEELAPGGVGEQLLEEFERSPGF
ncbi:GNAT family N-acetyltransferase [Actinoplanes sp. NPDC051343]|uniref:GNAT family N-acetyltransferase n=1 Tax=Actinoplanes sp. NPDC051343 TaxID=3363906 RepID=UPI0037930596